MFYSENTELNQVYLKLKEGKLREGLHLVKQLENKDNLIPEVALLCKVAKADLLRLMGEIMESIKICELIYPLFQQKGDLKSSFDVLLIQTYSYMLIANVNKSETLFKQTTDLFKTIKDKFSIDLIDRKSLLLRINAGIQYFKGEIKKFLELNKQAHELAKETGDKGLISASLGNIAQAYMQMKQLDKALVSAKAAVELNYKNSFPNSLVTLIEVYVNRGEIKQAEKSLDIFHDYIKKRATINDKSRYIYSKALVLKSSLRARNRVKSEELFRKLALDDRYLAEYRIDALINLCDLYLIELRITNDLEIINEIQPFIRELLNIAQNQHLNLILAETYFLQAKLSILTSNIKQAQEFLTQAQNLAESFGLEMLAMKISNEHDNLLKQTKLWKQDKDIPLVDRLELASLEEQMEYMTKKRIIEIPELSEEEPIFLLILSEGGIPIYSKSFTEDDSFEDHLFGGFLTSVNAFINEKFSEGLKRASFGKYTLIMESVSPFLFCYVYEGQSYSALTHIKTFIDEMKANKEVWLTFEKYYRINQVVQKEEVPSLDSIITKIFIQKSIPNSQLS